MPINQNSSKDKASGSASNAKRKKRKKIRNSSRIKNVKSSTPKRKKSAVFNEPFKNEQTEKMSNKFQKLTE